MAAVAGMLAASGFTGSVNAEVPEAVAEEATQSETEEETQSETEEETQAGTEGETQSETEEETQSETEEETAAETEEETEADAEEDTRNDAPQEKEGISEEQNGWVVSEGKTYYYVDGVKVARKVMQIGKSLYGFDTYGVMYQNASFSLVIDGRYQYFRAKSDGRLYRSEWYMKTWNGSVDAWYYYGADGAGVSGIVKVSGKEYLFDYSGELIVNKAIQTQDGKWYVGDENGYPTLISGSGWKKVGDGWYYMKYGSPVMGAVIRVGSKLYCFDDDGRMVTDNFTYSKFEGTMDVERFHAGKDGVLTEKSWYKYEDGNWYYFGEGGAAYTGYRTIGKNDYYFNYYGEMVADTTIILVDGPKQGIFYLDPSGKATPLSEGWNKVGSEYLYVMNGEPLKETVSEINGKLYAFSGSGVMYKNCCFRHGDDCYRAKANGELYSNTWFQTTDGKWYYYNHQGIALRGAKKVEGHTYIFTEYFDTFYNTNGQMLQGTKTVQGRHTWIVAKNGYASYQENGWLEVDGDWYYYENDELCTSTVKKIDGKYYGFDGRGKMYRNTRFSVGTEYYRSTDGSGALLTDAWYGMEYYGKNGAAQWRSFSVNGKKYYSRGGKAVCNEYVISEIDNMLYLAGSNGVLSEVTKDGIYFVYDPNTLNRVPCCVENGKLVRSAWRKLGGKYYYFGSSGGAYTGSGYQIGDSYYYFHNDGTMMNNGWNYLPYGGVVYLKGSGEALTGVQKLGNKYYYFGINGIMQTGIQRIDGVEYYYDQNGAYVGKLNGDGWTQLSGLWFYAENGKHKYGGNYTINDKEYYFDQDGIMLTDHRKERRIYGKNGARITSGWVYMDGNWYYVDPVSNLLVSGSYTIGGKHYIFWDYVLKTEDTYDEMKTVYRIGSDGVVTATEKLEDGWNAAAGCRIYLKDGVPYTGWLGNVYLRYGKPTNQRYDHYYTFDGKGDLVKDQGVYSFATQVIDYGTPYRLAEKYYINEKGIGVAEEWVKLGGNWYYFGSDHGLVTESFMKDHTLYLIDTETGKLLKSVSHPEDGWYAVGSSWLYVEAGMIKDGEFVEKSKVYNTYNMPGSMATTNTVGNDTPYNNIWAVYYHGNTGAGALKTGWQTINGKTYYFGTNGACYDGWFTVGGKTYYSTPGTGILTGWESIDGSVLYHFGTDGALTETYTGSNGWVKKGNDWYYFKGGRLYERTLLIVNNKTYLMMDGRMVKNGTYGGYYADANGEIMKNTWKKIGIGWYYFGADGHYLTGTWMIGGKLYSFDQNGLMLN